MLADGVLPRLRDILTATPRGPGFGNSQHVRNLLDQAIAVQVLWITADVANATDVRRLLAEDLSSVSAWPPDEDPGFYL